MTFWRWKPFDWPCFRVAVCPWTTWEPYGWTDVWRTWSGRPAAWSGWSCPGSPGPGSWSACTRWKSRCQPGRGPGARRTCCSGSRGRNREPNPGPATRPEGWPGVRSSSKAVSTARSTVLALLARRYGPRSARSISAGSRNRVAENGNWSNQIPSIAASSRTACKIDRLNSLNYLNRQNSRSSQRSH